METIKMQTRLRLATVPGVGCDRAEVLSAAPHGKRLGQRAARWWDLAGVLALMGSSAAYGVFSLAHLRL